MNILLENEEIPVLDFDDNLEEELKETIYDIGNIILEAKEEKKVSKPLHYEAITQAKKGNVDWYNTLDDKKAYIPFMVNRIMQSYESHDIEETLEVRKYANIMLNVDASLSSQTIDFKSLHYRLLVSLLKGRKGIIAKNVVHFKKGGKTNENTVFNLYMEYYNISFREVLFMKESIKLEDVLEMAASFGYEKDKIRKLKNDFKNIK